MEETKQSSGEERSPGAVDTAEPGTTVAGRKGPETASGYETPEGVPMTADAWSRGGQGTVDDNIAAGDRTTGDEPDLLEEMDGDVPLPAGMDEHAPIPGRTTGSAGDV